MHKSKILFVNTQQCRCGNCGKLSLSWGEMKAAGRHGEQMSAPDCQCEWAGWSSDYFHIDEKFQDRFGFGYEPGSRDASIVPFPFVHRPMIDRS